MSSNERSASSQILFKKALITTDNSPTPSGDESWDLLKNQALEELTFFEDMFAPSLSGRILIKDFLDFSSILPLKGNELLYLTIQEPDETEKELTPFQIFSIEQIDNPEFNAMRGFEIKFASRDHLQGDYDSNHLYEDGEYPEESKGLISEFVDYLITNNVDFDVSGEEQPYIEETTNKIWYRVEDEDYASLRKDGPQKFLDLMHQLAENAYSENEEDERANYFFYQDLDKWNFRSVSDLIEEGKDVDADRTYYYSLNLAGQTGLIRNRISEIIRAKRSDHLELLENGAYKSNFTYYRPKVDTSRFPIWYTPNIKRTYYRVNCRYRDHFPAAIVGFQQVEPNKAQWRYAFAEVYLVFDYENLKPSFRFKPVNRGAVRSWLTFKEDGPHWLVGEDDGTVEGAEYDYFGRPAYNTIEMGNDGYFNYDDRVGWEAPGVRLDSQLWENGCFKIQPIRGSMSESTIHLGPDEERNNIVESIDINSINEDINSLDKNEPWKPTLDDAIVDGKFPIVDMKIYWDFENEPHYFFSVANATDGECSDDEGDCKDSDVG